MTLEAKYLQAIIDLGDCCFNESRLGDALEWYRRGLTIDPLREDIYRRVMSSLAQADRRAEALRAYENCARVLKRELGVGPGRGMRMLREEIGGL